MRISRRKLEGGGDIVVDHALGVFFHAGADENDARPGVEIGEVEIEHVFEAPGGGTVRDANYASLAGRKFLERLPAIETDGRDSSAFGDMKRKFHKTRFRSEQRKIEEPLARERRAAVDLIPLPALGRQPII